MATTLALDYLPYSIHTALFLTNFAGVTVNSFKIYNKISYFNDH